MLTDTEKQAILDEIEALELYTAGDGIVATEINSTIVDGTVIAEDKRLLPKPEVLAMISDSSLINMLDFFAAGTDQARAFQYRWDSLENLDLTHPVTRGSIQALQAGGIFTADEATTVLAYGERAKTKSDEILGRLMTATDVTEARI